MPTQAWSTFETQSERPRVHELGREGLESLPFRTVKVLLVVVGVSISGVCAEAEPVGYTDVYLGGWICSVEATHFCSLSSLNLGPRKAPGVFAVQTNPQT